MRANFSSLIFICLVIITNNVCTIHSKCYLDPTIAKQVKRSDLPNNELRDCLNLTKIICRDDVLQNLRSRSQLLDILANEGRGNIQFSTKAWDPTKKFVLNVSMNDTWFKKVIIHLRANNEPYEPTTCYSIDLAISQDLNLSAILSVPIRQDMTIEIFMEADGSNYFRNYTFKLPDKNLHDNCIFTWIDISDPNCIRLNIQPLDKAYNVTMYRVQVMCAKELIDTFNMSTEKFYHDWSNYLEEDMSCYFDIKPIDNQLNAECVAHSAFFSIPGSSRRLIIMVVSIVFVPFAVFIVLQQAYVRYTNYRRSGRNPTCLLIHPGSPTVHVNAMIKLAEYLRGCNINAMIDVLDISKESLNNPDIWCQKAYEKAITIIISGTPFNVDGSQPIYRFLYKFALNLVHADDPDKRRLNEKQYITLKFPYCKNRHEIPPYVRSFDVIKLPKDLDKLVKKICGYDNAELYKQAPLKREFVKSVQIANSSIRNGIEGMNSSSEVHIPCDLTIDTSEERLSESEYSYSSDPESATDDEEIWDKKVEDDEENDEQEEMIEDTYNTDAMFSGNGNDYYPRGRH